MTLEDRNYWNDARTREQSPLRIDEQRRVALVLLEDEDGNEDEHAIPFEWVVCSLCGGKGSHVNPSIDCGGLSQEDLDDDPDFRESYYSGGHDVTCNECSGRRVVPELQPRTTEQRAAVRALEDRKQEDAVYKRECRAERAMGA